MKEDQNENNDITLEYLLDFLETEVEHFVNNPAVPDQWKSSIEAELPAGFFKQMRTKLEKSRAGAKPT